MPADPNHVVCFGGQVRGMTTWSWKTRRASIASNHLVRCGRTPLSSRHSANHRQAKTPLQMSARVRCRSEEHTSELLSLLRTSSAVFCLNKKKQTNTLQKI